MNKKNRFKMVKIFVSIVSFMVIVGIILGIFNGSIESKQSRPSDSYRLSLVQIVFRHGDRTPLRLYVNDPYKRSDFIEGLGELTNRGKLRMFRIGSKLRHYYSSYLENVSNKNIYARSSPRRRCLESCSMVLAGLFPPRPDEIWNQDPNGEEDGKQLAKLWQPISINTVEASRDRLLYPEAECSEAIRYEQIINDSPSVKPFLEANKQFIDDLIHYTGTNFTIWLEIGYLYSTLTVEQEYFGDRFQKPSWIDKMGNDTMERLRKFHDLEFSVFSKSKAYVRLRAGSILKQIQENIDAKIQKDLTQKDNNSKDRKGFRQNHLHLYSTHDTMLGYVVSAFGGRSMQPTYGSGLSIELWTNKHDPTSKPYIRLMYLDGISPGMEIEPLEMISEPTIQSENCNRSNCNSEYFDYDCLKAFLNDYLPRNIDQECTLSVKSSAITEYKTTL
ncbi:Testicular acid phosphatase-like protein [Sarcoptes scabiei]|nr:Testicular acid phosphatase-like protein [Sarcoptes scabiei]